MNDENPSDEESKERESPRSRRPVLIRVLRTLKHKLRRKKRVTDEEHAENERSTARWTRTVGIFTVVLGFCAILANVITYLQLGEMHSGGVDTHSLAIAASNEATAMSNAADAMSEQAKATDKLLDSAKIEAAAMDKLRKAGEDQATAMGRLVAAGQVQAKATQLLADAGRSQAGSTAALATATANQLAAIQTQADAAKAQAVAVTLSSKATNRLADAGQAQSAAVLDSLKTAKDANAIAQQNAISANRPWAGFSLPGNIVPQVGQEYTVEAGLFNYGRSPAVDATVTVKIDIIPTAQNISTLDSCINSCQIITIFPTTGLGGTGYAYHPKIAKDKATPDEIEKLKSRQDTIILLERVDYKDSYGYPHFTIACSFFILT